MEDSHIPLAEKGISIRATFSRISNVLTKIRGGGAVRKPKAVVTEVVEQEDANQIMLEDDASDTTVGVAEFSVTEDVFDDVSAVTHGDTLEDAARMSDSPARASPRGFPKFTDTDGIAKVLDWSADNLKRCTRQCVHDGSRIMSCPSPTSLRNMIGDGYNSFQGARGVLDHPSAMLVNTPGLFNEAGRAIDSTRYAFGLPRIKDLLLKNFKFFKVYHDGRTYFYCSTSQFPGSEVYSTPSRCLLCDRIADSLGGEIVGVGNKKVHCFESTEIAARFLCLSIMLTAGTSNYLLTFLKRARKWNNRKQFQSNRHGSKISSESNHGFFVVAFGNSPRDRNKDMREKMPYFFVVARDVDIHSHEASRPKYTSDFAIVIPDLTFYRKHYANPSCPKPKKNDLGMALYIRPLQLQSHLFGEVYVHDSNTTEENLDDADTEPVSPNLERDV